MRNIIRNIFGKENIKKTVGILSLSRMLISTLFSQKMFETFLENIMKEEDGDDYQEL
jgi:hypothetical protein